MVPFRALGVSLLLLASFGCEKDPPKTPQVAVDRTPVAFAPAFVNTKPQESLAISNDGLADLTLTSVALSGDSVFTLEGPLETTLGYKKRTFVRLVFAPTSAKEFNATLTIVSNAANSPSLQVPVSGKGVAP